MRYKKLVTHVESHARAEFARERRIALHKSDQQRQQQQQQQQHASKAHNDKFDPHNNRLSCIKSTSS